MNWVVHPNPSLLWALAVYVYNTPILMLRLLPELVFEKAKTDERIPLFLWPSAMVGFEEDEEGAGPCHHDPGQSSDVK